MKHVQWKVKRKGQEDWQTVSVREERGGTENVLSCVCLCSAVVIVSEEARREPSFPLVQRVCVMTLSLLSPSVWAHARPICRSVMLDHFYLSSTSFFLPAFLCRSPAYCLSCIWSIVGFNMLCCLLRLLSYVMNKSFTIYNLMHLFCLSFLAGFLKTQILIVFSYWLTDNLINSTQWLPPPKINQKSTVNKICLLHF